MSDELVLLEYWASPYVARVKVALEEKGITNYECRHEDNVLNAKSSLLLKMNPAQKKVPVLIHNGKPVCESLVIVEYIDEVWKHKSPTLLPIDAFERARARFWADYNDKTLINIIPKLWEQKGGIQQNEKKDFINYLKLLEVELGEKLYFGGNTFGYLDVVLISGYSWFYSYEKCTKSNIVGECPKLIAWAKRCEERDSVKKSLPNKLAIYEKVLELQKTFEKD